MTETFIWSPRVDPNEDTQYRVLSAQYGDGYSQEVADGINSQVSSWDLNFVYKDPTATDICNFLDRHKGAKSFLWTPPWGPETYWKCRGKKRSHLGGGMFLISVKFEQSFKP